jgi:two-component system sensor histidine kinase/response regulator
LEDIAVTDMEENLVYVNNSFANLLGYNRNELEGMHLRNLTDEKNYKKIRRQATLRKKGRTSRYEIQLQGRDGKPRPVQVSAAPLWDDMEVYVGSVGVITDLTENKRTQEEIRREQELLHALMDNIPHGIYFKDVDSRFTLINKAQAQILGVKIADQAIGKTDFDYFTKEHAQDAFKNEQRVMKTGQPLISKIEKVRRADGKFLWVSSTKAPIKNDDGKATGLVGISEDVPKLKLMEDSLAYERDLLEALMDNIPDAIYFKDAESRFVRVNSAHAHRMGLKDAEEARGKTDFDFYASEFAQNTYRDEQKVVKTGKPMIGDIEKIIQKDGKVRWVTATKMPLRDKDGLITGLVGISRDITTLKRMEEELRKYSEHLEEVVEERTRKLKEAERLATIGETTAMVGHDLRNPLQVIVNSVYLSNRRLEKLPSKLKIIKELREHIKTIEEQTIYMDKIVSDLQEYSIALKPQPVQVNLNTLIADTLSTIIVPEKIDIHLEIPRNLPLLLADPRLMKKVFANVITNGLQAMPYGGHLTIEASLEHEAVSIKVQDTGVGMSRETLRQIFQPFFTTKVKGQGLGLAVCKRLVEAQGGSIKVASEPGKGSTFTVNIPLEGRAPQIKEKIALDLLKKGQKLSTQFHSQH